MNWFPQFITKWLWRSRFLLLRKPSTFYTRRSFANHLPVLTLSILPSCGLLTFVWPFTRRTDSSNDDCPSPAAVTRKLFGQSLLFIRYGDYAQANSRLHQLLEHLYQKYQNHSIDGIGYASQRARVCSELASLHLLQGQLEPAEALLKQTVQDCVTAGLLVTSAEIVELSLKLALIYDQLGRDSEADTGYQFCVTSQEKKQSSDDQLHKVSSEVGGIDKEIMLNEDALLGMCCNYYARFLFSRGDTKSAVHYAERSLQVARRIYPADHPNCLNLLSSLGAMHVDLEEEGLEQARAYLKQAYDLARPCFDASQQQQQASGDRHVRMGSLANILVEWAVVEARAGERATAGRLLAEAEAVLKSPEPSAHNDVYHQRLTEMKSEYSL